MLDITGRIGSISPHFLLVGPWGAIEIYNIFFGLYVHVLILLTCPTIVFAASFGLTSHLLTFSPFPRGIGMSFLIGKGCLRVIRIPPKSSKFQWLVIIFHIGIPIKLAIFHIHWTEPYGKISRFPKVKRKMKKSWALKIHLARYQESPKDRRVIQQDR